MAGSDWPPSRLAMLQQLKRIFEDGRLVPRAT